jgi:hypothetical protein
MKMKRWLTFAAAALAATTLIGFSLLGPASAHITSNVGHTFNHIKNKMGYEVVTINVSVAAGSFVRDTANCPKGKEVLGGGAQVAGEGTDDFDTVIQESAPGITGNNINVWLVSIQNDDTANHDVNIYAVCADVA